jgi:hypothetical protein
VELAARRRSVGEVLDAAFDLVRHNARLLIGLAALIYLPIALMMPAVDPTRASADPIGALREAGPALLYALLVSPIVSIALIAAAGDLARGRPARFGQALRSGVSLLVPFAWAWTLALGIVLLAFAPLGAALEWRQLPTLVRAAGIAAGLILPLVAMLRFLLLGQVVVIERARGLASLRRSAQLVKGSPLRCGGILLLGLVLTFLLGEAVQLALGWIHVVGGLLAGLAQAVGLAYTTALGVVLYLDQRARRGERSDPAELSGA